MDKVRVGIIGTGFMGPVHLDALRRLGYVDVVAVAEDGLELAQEKAELLHIAKAYGNYTELLSDPDIDAVHICTPNHLHFEIAKKALESGKHVLCEKPLSLNSVQANELVEVARLHSELENGLNFNIRFYPLVEQIAFMIASGELGRILAVNGSYQQDWLFYETDYNWRLQPEFSGASRAISDIGSHWLDLVEFITGLRITQVCADFATFHPTRKKPLKPAETYTGKLLSNEDYVDVPIHTEDYASVLLGFDNGAHGSLTVNQVAAGRKNRLYFEIYGDKKSVAWDCENPNEMWVGRRDGGNEQFIKDPSLMYPGSRAYARLPGGHTEGFFDTVYQLFGRFYQQIISGGQQGKREFPTFEDGARDILLCDFICKSSEQRKWIDVP